MQLPPPWYTALRKGILVRPASRSPVVLDLELLKTLDSDGRLAEHHRLDAVRAHLLEMLGDHGRRILG
jgi:hypothetical protein